MRPLPPWRRLSVQITVPIIIVMLLLFSAMVVYFEREQRTEADSRAELELRAMLVVAQGSLNRILTIGRPEAIAELISEMYVHPRVKNAVLLNREGQNLDDYVVNLVKPDLQNFLAEISQESLTRALDSGMTIIEYHPQHGHFVAFVPTIQSGLLDEQLTRNLLVVEWRHEQRWYQFDPLAQREIALLGLVLLVLALLLWLALHIGVVQPVRTLVTAFERLARREPFQKALNKKYYNEFGRLIKAILNAAKARERYDRELQRLSAAVEQSNDSIFITNLDGQIEYVNRAFERTTGYSAAEVLGQNPRILASGQTPAETYSSMWAALRQGKDWRGELYNQKKDGTELREWITISPLRDDQGVIRHYLANKQNITDQRAAEQQIHQLAFYDQLTGLANRALSKQYVSEFLARRQKDKFGAIVLFDLDGLQRLNDVRGYAFGDQVLVIISQRCLDLIKQIPGARLGNLGGDLFALMLPTNFAEHHVRRKVETIVEDLLGLISKPIELDNEVVNMTASAGLVVYPFPGGTSESLLRYAETAVFEAKRGGGNQLVIYNEELSAELESRFELERDLRVAIGTDQLSLYLQPKHRVDGQLVGVEILCRWQHPQRGFIAPDLFIDIAEQSDLIVELGEWIQRTALNVLARLPSHLNLAINVSPRQFRKRNFVEKLKVDLQATSIQPHRLTLEVTENLLLGDLNDIRAKMATLSDLGVKFSIDDFGTGYSSLGYLSDLPINELKIDRRFILGIGDARLEKIVDLVIAMGEYMDLLVVAEGVETEQHVNYLRAQSEAVICQGYYFSKPLPEDAFFEDYLSRFSP